VLLARQAFTYHDRSSPYVHDFLDDALVVAMTTFGAVYAGIHGAQITGSFLGVGGLGTIVATFISGRKLPAKTQDGGD
jgi:hypothetical protein